MCARFAQGFRGGVRRFIRPELALVVGLLCVYNVNLRQVSSFDTYASRLAPISLLRDGDLVLDEFFPDALAAEAETEASGALPYFFNYLIHARGHFYDSHSPVGPLLALPVYAVPVWLGIPRDPILAANVLSKLAASVMAALSALALFAAIRGLLTALGWAPGRERRIALLAALAYGLGTPVWSTAALALWTHGPAVLASAVALWALSSGRTGLAGAAAAAAVVARPATAPAAAVLLVYVLHLAWRSIARDGRGSVTARASIRRVVSCGAWALAIGGLGAAYNLWLFGNLVGGAPLRTSIYFDLLDSPGMFSGSLLEGLAGLTVSPSRGILVFSPIVLLAVVGTMAVWRSRLAGPTADPTPERDAAMLLARYASVSGLVMLLTYSKFIAWWGGHGFGPRYLADAMPLLGILMGLGFARFGAAIDFRFARQPLAAAAVLVLLTYSVFIQGVGAFCWPAPWTERNDPPYYQRLWDWRDNQIASCLRAGPRFDPVARRLLGRLGLRGG
jgi:hypothetical protein